MYKYKPVEDFLDFLKSNSDQLDFNQTLKIGHHDGSEFQWSGCHYTFYSFLVSVKGRDQFNLNEYEVCAETTEEVTCLVVIPEHHPAVWYDVEDLYSIEEVINEVHTYVESVSAKGKSQKKLVAVNGVPCAER